MNGRDPSRVSSLSLARLRLFRDSSVSICRATPRFTGSPRFSSGYKSLLSTVGPSTVGPGRVRAPVRFADPFCNNQGNSMKKLSALLSISISTLVTSHVVRAETVMCLPITTVPVTISVPGSYCLTGNLETAITSGSAITIATDNVVLDFNGFELTGSVGAYSTFNRGIYASQQSRISIRNGSVTGFNIGIFLDDPSPYYTAQSNLIEEMSVDHNTYAGIFVLGKNSVIRHNRITSTGRGLATNASAFAIRIAGTGMRIVDNDVADVTSSTASGFGIYAQAANAAIVEGNRLNGVAAGNSFSYGIYAYASTGMVIKGNSLSDSLRGVYLTGGSTGTIRDNTTSAVTSPYFGGTLAGSTNF
jgi:parallel beta-helix repeat protein